MKLYQVSISLGYADAYYWSRRMLPLLTKYGARAYLYEKGNRTLVVRTLTEHDEIPRFQTTDEYHYGRLVSLMEHAPKAILEIPIENLTPIQKGE